MLTIPIRSTKLNNVLLVEDNQLINIYNERIIQQLDITHHVQIVGDAEEALDYLCGRGKYELRDEDFSLPELIFLDINMPRMNGWEFIDEFKKLKELDEFKSHKTTIVMLTTSPNPDDAKRALNIPEISDYQKKPLTKSVLSELMRKLFPLPTSE